MEIAVPPQKDTAMSTTWNSAMLRSMSTTRVPRPTLFAASPAAAAATRWAYSAKVHSPHVSSSLRQRTATSSAQASTVRTNACGIVWPSTSDWISALVAMSGSPCSSGVGAHPRS